jgi:hypothetical protein
MRILQKLDETYDLLEIVESDAIELDKLRYERSIVQNYISQMGLRSQHLREMIETNHKP